MIRARGLTKRFRGQTVLEGLDLDVGRGERVALLGLNGTGKTTLFRCLLGLVPFDGQLAIDGLDVVRRGRDVRGRIGYVPQRPPQFNGTLIELVTFFGGLRGADAAVVGERLEALSLPLADHADKPVRALSGGMLQKVLLALATAAGAPLLLLDEPTANLDARARRDFVRALGRVPEGTTVFLSSHRLEDIRAVADRLLLLHGGRIVFDGDIAGLERQAGASSTLWIRPADVGLEEVATRLSDDPRVSNVRRNGTRIGLEATAGALPDVLADLRAAGIGVADFETETPSLEHLLDRVLRKEDR